MSITVAMRFDRSDASKLRALADRAKIRDLLADVSTYELAADAAERGTALQFECENADEAQLIAAGFVVNGCTLPTIDAVRTD